jgi:hypothetical protein
VPALHIDHVAYSPRVDAEIEDDELLRSEESTFLELFVVGRARRDEPVAVPVSADHPADHAAGSARSTSWAHDENNIHSVGVHQADTLLVGAVPAALAPG